MDGSKTRAYANKYNNLTSEDIAKLLHIVEQGIITDEEENKILENRNKKTLDDDDDLKKEQIKKALRESKNLKIKEEKTTNNKTNNDEDSNKSKDSSRKRPMKEAMRTDASKYDDEMYELIDDNNLNLCGKRIFRQAIEHPETAYKQVEKLEKCQEMIEKTGDNTVNYSGSRSKKKPKQRRR